MMIDASPSIWKPRLYSYIYIADMLLLVQCHDKKLFSPLLPWQPPCWGLTNKNESKSSFFGSTQFWSD